MITVAATGRLSGAVYVAKDLITTLDPVYEPDEILVGSLLTVALMVMLWAISRVSLLGVMLTPVTGLGPGSSSEQPDIASEHMNTTALLSNSLRKVFSFAYLARDCYSGRFREVCGFAMPAATPDSKPAFVCGQPSILDVPAGPSKLLESKQRPP
jgi:hypothetical protein